jgi:proteasome accessory factor A
VAQVAEYLKIGTTTLVLDMAEAGLLDDAPRPVDPVAALHALAADASLSARVAMVGGEPMRALDIQRDYLRRARAFLRSARTASLEGEQVVALWGEVLDALERDPSRLFGVLDWPTKRALIERCAEGGAASKKIDLRYHELGSGYFARLEQSGLARAIVREDEIDAALRTAPEHSPARLRGALVREVAQSGGMARASWHQVRLGSRLRGKVVPLKRRE